MGKEQHQRADTSETKPAKPKREAATKISISGGKVLLTAAQSKAMQATKEISGVVSAIGSKDGKIAAKLVVEGIDYLIKCGDVGLTD